MNSNKTVQLKLRVSEKELDQIQSNAQAMDKTVSAYIREVSTNFCVLQCDYQQIIDHKNEITALRNAINQLIYTIIKTGDSVPADLEFILKQMNEITKSENSFVNLMLDEQEKKTKAISKEVKKIVRQKLASSKK